MGYRFITDGMLAVAGMTIERKQVPDDQQTVYISPAQISSILLIVLTAPRYYNAIPGSRDSPTLSNAECVGSY